MPGTGYQPIRTPPPLISTGDPGSFARHTIEVRFPALLDTVVEKNRLGEPFLARFLAFKGELTRGPVTDPFAQYPFDPQMFEPQEIAVWRRQLAGQAGRSWVGIPWYFAESLYFLKILFASGYYQPGSESRGRDPFAPFKEEELAPAGGGREVAAQLAPLIGRMAKPLETLRALLVAALWGNRMDLSYTQVARQFRGSLLHHEAHELLVDHSREVAQALLQAQRVDVILDNAGSELVCDLLLSGFLLNLAEQRRVVLHAKRSPYYISDATPKDVLATVKALAEDGRPEVGRAGVRLSSLLEKGRLEIREHYFWNGPLLFPDLPAEIRRELDAADLVLMKGDANYRRLLSDRTWDPWTNMEEVAGYFPAPFAVLRTLKSELVVDLSPELVQKLDREDPQWRVNGKRGMIRCLKPK